MKTSNRSAWWLVALVLAVCLLVLGYRHLNRQAGKGDHNPYAYDIDAYKEVDGELLGRGDAVDAILLANRLGTLIGTRSAYDRADAAYWSSPTADLGSVTALVLGITRRGAHTWRGRTYD